MGSLWKAFQMLLQNCCSTDFKMIQEKLVEDQMEQIESVKEEYGRYKAAIDETSKKTELELTMMQSLFSEVSEDKELQTKKRQESDRKLMAL